ncbi:unnamed protein product [Toxocara canis]|uniref:ZP domain-containing protein n=1 Tax=Toxocara canis TaxID=6265 RepID=A0A183UIM0_TOXCA|nr:unnamed protein product [Toxocara canis]
MENVEYTNSGGLMAKTKSQMFKFLKRTSFKISCRIQACEQNQPDCFMKTPPKCAITKEDVQLRYSSPRSASSSSSPLNSYSHEGQWAAMSNEVTVVSHWLVASSARLEWEIQHAKNKVLRATVEKNQNGDEQATGSRYEHLFFASTSRLDPRVPRERTSKLGNQIAAKPHVSGDERETVTASNEKTFHDGSGTNSTKGDEPASVYQDEARIGSGIKEKPLRRVQHQTSLHHQTTSPPVNMLVVTPFNDTVFAEGFEANKGADDGNDSLEIKATWSQIENVLPTQLITQSSPLQNFSDEFDGKEEDSDDQILQLNSNSTFSDDGVENERSREGGDDWLDGTVIPSEPKNESAEDETEISSLKFQSDSEPPSALLVARTNATTRKLYKLSSQSSAPKVVHEFGIESHQQTPTRSFHIAVTADYPKVVTAADETSNEQLETMSNDSRKQSQPLTSTVFSVLSTSFTEDDHEFFSTTKQDIETDNLELLHNTTVSANAASDRQATTFAPRLINSDPESLSDFENANGVESASNKEPKVSLDKHERSKSTRRKSVEGVIRLVSNESGTDHRSHKSGIFSQVPSTSELQSKKSAMVRKGETESSELDDEQRFFRSRPDLFTVRNFMEMSTTSIVSTRLEPFEQFEREPQPFRLHSLTTAVASLSSTSTAKLTTGQWA